jgi:hypothetical protein
MGQHALTLDATPLEHVTTDMIRLALAERAEEMAPYGGQLMPLDQFFADADLDTYRRASAWWPTDAPASCALFTIRELCNTVWRAPGTVGGPHLSFAEVLTLMGQKCAEWLASEGRDVRFPNETRDERRRRLAREGMSRSRALTRAAAADPGAVRVRALYAAYLGACAARKSALAAVHAGHDPLVAAALAQWEAAKAEVS